MIQGYNFWTLLIGILLAGVSSYAAFAVATSVTPVRVRGLVASGLLLGVATAAMHLDVFIAVAGAALPLPKIIASVLALVLAAAAGGAGLWVAGREQSGALRFLAGGTILTLGIASFHFIIRTGVWDEAPAPSDPLLIIGSIAFAIAASLTAFQFAAVPPAASAMTRRWRLLASAVCMIVGIFGLYVLEAVGSVLAPPARSLAVPLVGDALVLFTLLVLGLALGTSLLSRRLAAQDAALQASERRYRSLFDQNPSAVVSLDREGTFQTANAAAETLTGYPHAELLHQSLYALVVPEDVDLVRERFARALAGAPQTYKIAIKNKEGRRLNLHVTNLPILVDGAIVGVYCIAQDITERQQAEQALRESEDRYRRLVDLSPDAVIVHSDGRVVYMNAAGAHLLGASSTEELIGAPVMDFVHPDYHAIVKARIQHQIEHGGTATLLEETFVRRDGTLVDVEVTGTSISYLGRPASQVVVRDISERKHAERELRRQNEYLAALHETTLGLMNRLHLSDLLEAIVVRAAALLDTPDGYIYLVDPVADNLEVKVGIGIFSRHVGFRLERGEGLAGRVWQTGEPLLVNSYDNWEGR